ncbi:MAG: diaminopimelate epimerase [Rhodothermales bacterium]
MQRKLIVEFTKMNGAGNDFIVIDNRFYNFSDDELAAIARTCCPRRVGIGADGVLAFSTPVDTAHHYRMRYLNADGSVGTMCGNGARCLARFARNIGFSDEEMHFESDAGPYRAFVPAAPNGPVRLFVPSPKDWIPNRPLLLDTSTTVGAVHFLWTGTEHAVCFVNDVNGIPVQEWGPAIRNDQALAPAGANVDFVQVLSEGSAVEAAVLQVRTFEKGVEQETLACGTGALASAFVARFLGYIQRNTVQVHMPGGMLTVGFDLKGETVRDVYLEGPAVSVYRGTFEL